MNTFDVIVAQEDFTKKMLSMEKQIKFIQKNLFKVSPYMTPESINNFYTIVRKATGSLHKHHNYMELENKGE